MNKKDCIPNYILRNALLTFIAAFISFMISIMSFYQCSIVESIQHIFFIDIYTTLYFLLIWLLNYMIFEISKIIYDEYRQILSYKPIILFILMIVIIYILPLLDLFQYDFIILCLFIILRIIKEMLKKTY
ncbi:MAG: hypothetical protein LUG12_10635 [Erysipelotrichaceae bacterium]|nr:hypothetical protein [Erysipelotrichaceae bacterium]